jgi:hypothetical protein
MKAAAAAMARKLEQIPTTGVSIANDLRGIGIHAPAQLIGQERYAWYERVNRITGLRLDPCFRDCFIAAVRFMEGGEAVPWWIGTAERRQRFATTVEVRS